MPNALEYWPAPSGNSVATRTPCEGEFRENSRDSTALVGANRSEATESCDRLVGYLASRVRQAGRLDCLKLDAHHQSWMAGPCKT